jgi:hypothetical protein
MNRLLILLALVLSVLLGLSQTASAVDRGTGHLRMKPGTIESFPSPPVYRDFLPSAVDLSDYFPLVGDQGSEGSCVSWAVGFAARSYYARMVEGRDTTKLENIPSPAFLYNATNEGTPDDEPCSVGSYTDNVLTLLQSGAMSLAQFPYKAGDCPALTQAQLAKGTDFKIESFYKVGNWDPSTWLALPGTVNAIKAELAKGNPVIVGMMLNDTFEKTMYGPGGMVIWNPGPIQEGETDGHEVLLVGYDDDQGTFKLLNSWSSEWGDRGFARITYEGFMNRADEAWVIQMPGDPDIALKQADFRPDVIEWPSLKLEPNVGAAGAAKTVAVEGLWCGSVDVGGQPGSRIASGFVSSEAALGDLKTQLGEGVDATGVEVSPWPMCETRLTLAGALASDTLKVDVKAGSDGGHNVDVGAFGGHLYLVTYDDDTAHVAEVQAGNSASVAAGTDGALVIGSQQPLLAAMPDGLPARDFLNMLRDSVRGSDLSGISARLVALN